MKIISLLCIYAVSCIICIGCLKHNPERTLEAGIYEMTITHMDSTKETIVYQQTTHIHPDIVGRNRRLIVYYPSGRVGVRPYTLSSRVHSFTLTKKP